MSRVFISATHKSSGKTTISIGLCAMLTRLGYRVQSFKKGPDYIDPLWLSQATQYPCFNLDFNTQSHDEINGLFARHSTVSDISLIEGNKGLYDGVEPDGSDCNAALAKQLSAPVILVVDAQGITRGVAPLINGYLAFDEDIEIAGVILNKVGSSRHESKLRQAIDKYCHIPVFGALHRHHDLVIDERHIGLVPGNEHDHARKQIQTVCEHIEKCLDTDTLIQHLALQQADHTEESFAKVSRVSHGVRIGIARDSAFGFYYHDDLCRFGQHDAELVNIDLIHDERLPDIDGLFIGGGFPETHMRELHANQSMRSSIKLAIENNLPVYAECGGLMYLCRQIEWNGNSCQMVGAIPADVKMHERPQGRGYVRIKPTGDAPWQVKAGQSEICAHEFHHSTLENIDTDLRYAYKVIRGYGINGTYDGLIYRNVIAGYAHLRSTSASPWVDRFVEFIKQQRGGDI